VVTNHLYTLKNNYQYDSYCNCAYFYLVLLSECITTALLVSYVSTIACVPTLMSCRSEMQSGVAP